MHVSLCREGWGGGTELCFLSTLKQNSVPLWVSHSVVIIAYGQKILSLPKLFLTQECRQSPWCYSGSEQSMLPLTVMAAVKKCLIVSYFNSCRIFFCLDGCSIRNHITTVWNACFTFTLSYLRWVHFQVNEMQCVIDLSTVFSIFEMDQLGKNHWDRWKDSL